MLPDRLERFIERIPESGCWIWTGALVGMGYGKACWVVDGQRKQGRAHRVVYEELCKPLRAEVCLLHRCDVACCVNPAHMRLGSQSENHAEMVAKRRHAFGERQGGSKLTEQQVREILLRRESRREAAAKYGVSLSLIKQIRARLWWKHLDAGVAA